MKRARLTTATGDCHCWIGGEGPPLLLVHGGWAGAEAHWNSVWGSLAERHTVLAIELRGIWNTFEADVPSYPHLAAACGDLLDALGLAGVDVVGNSLGASIGWQLALDRPELVRHLIVVNGFPPRPLPMRKILAMPPFRWLALRSLMTNFYSQAVFKTAFVDASHIPEAIKDNLAREAPTMAATMLRLLCSVSGDAGLPASRVDVIWGERDRLPEMKLINGRTLSAAIPGSRLVTVPNAGHLPQVENPDAFLAVVSGFLSEGGTPLRRPALPPAGVPRG